MMRIKRLNRLMPLVALLGSATAAQSQQTVSIAPAANGAVTVDDLMPQPGQVVTVTVTPDMGYVCKKSGIIAEATIAPEWAQAPMVDAAPQVGYYLPLDGEEPDDIATEASYTFVMPDAPLNVTVTVTFTRDIDTGLDKLAETATFVSTHYVKADGTISGQPRPGVNIVVMQSADGTKTAKKIVF